VGPIIISAAMKQIIPYKNYSNIVKLMTILVLTFTPFLLPYDLPFHPNKHVPFKFKKNKNQPTTQPEPLQ